MKDNSKKEFNHEIGSKKLASLKSENKKYFEIVEKKFNKLDVNNLDIGQICEDINLIYQHDYRDAVLELVFQKISSSGKQEELFHEITSKLDIFNISTEVDSDNDSDRTKHPSQLQISKLKEITTDKWGNNKISKDIKEGKLDVIAGLYEPPLQNPTERELFKKIAIDIMGNEFLSLDPNMRDCIYSDAKHQLELLGEDVSDVINAYDIGL